MKAGIFYYDSLLYMLWHFPAQVCLTQRLHSLPEPFHQLQDHEKKGSVDGKLDEVLDHSCTKKRNEGITIHHAQPEGGQSQIDHHRDQEGAYNDPHEGEFLSVEEETEEHADEDGVQCEAWEKESVGTDDVAQNITDESDDGSYEGAEQHAACSDGQGCEADLKGWSQWNLEQRQYNADGDEHTAQSDDSGFLHLLCGQLE